MSEPVSGPARNQIFISYSHRDREWLDRLLEHLAPYIRKYKLDVWDDSRITAGDNWRGSINSALDNAMVAVLLVSPSFLASDFIINKELQPLLDAAKEKGVRIIWVAVRHSAVRITELEAYQAANDPKRPLSHLTEAERDEELVRISEVISNAANPQ